MNLEMVWLEIPEDWRKRIDRVDACWIWTGQVDNNGLPYITISGCRYSLRREMYKEWKNKYLKDKVRVLSRCGNPQCLNPEHMYTRASGGRQPKNPEDKHNLTKQELAQEMALKLKEPEEPYIMQADLVDRDGNWVDLWSDGMYRPRP